MNCDCNEDNRDTIQAVLLIPTNIISFFHDINNVMHFGILTDDDQNENIDKYWYAFDTTLLVN